MSNSNKLKILNDPIYGFVTIPNSLIYDIVQHPYFQRLRRISQMGMSFLVFPGAHHTRFHHAIGCMHLMQKAVYSLRFKGVQISESEENALYIAILLHDIGHGPFSHAMEHSIVEGVHHEQLSLRFMHELNETFNGQLDLAIQVFKGEYPRQFMIQLISSQLDIDRLDYLKRDSFYSGVAEGNINSERIIQMLNVVDDVLVVEEKGIYSVEHFLVSRRLMYWQAYFHKTSLVAELILTKVFNRAKELAQKGQLVPCTKPLQYFLNRTLTQETFSKEDLFQFSLLDDSDIIAAIKTWMFEPDYVLSALSKMIINRDLLKIKMLTDKVSKEKVDELRQKLIQQTDITAEQAKYLVFSGKIKNQAYNLEDGPIYISDKKNQIKDVIMVSDQLNLKALTKPVTKYYLCFPKSLLEN
ncbi:HD domain-containing protein [Flavobacterium agricola]|uniref:HD domain-containing protein n=1 Tax=Flavobacterium agricola TaxID=2870839 RepID=A0ABY6M0C8_9FLAO|nr:HD domain-containing protein [Flavobacterium agricola]UYW02013.1 HD domain-containing protein [Flavobacterium agricola]